MAENKKYVELIWDQKYDKLKKGEKIPIEKPNLPFQVVETVNKPRLKDLEGGLFDPSQFYPENEYPGNYPKDWKNLLIWGDNKLVMSSLIKQGWAGKINLIYIDPPFFTGADFTIRTKLGDERIEKEPSIIEERAYRDTWSGGIASYLKYMYERLVLMRDLLAENGSIYVHLDWHVGHYVRVMMDEIFGYENLVNEIIWERKRAQAWETNRFGITNDSILLYSKAQEHIFNPIYSKHDENTKKYIEERFRYEDENGRKYMKSPLVNPLDRPNLKYEFRSVNPPAKGWLYSKERMEEMYRNNELVMPKNKNERIYRKIYLDEYKGQMIQNIWTDIPIINPMAKERLDFDTQKPEALLQRIILTSSNPGAIVADFFCGSGTTLAVAEKLGRRWIGSDLSKFAIQVTRKRLLDIHNSKDLMEEGK